MIYTSHGLMTPADLEEYRRSYDWDELRQLEPADDECDHGRLLTEDCEDCDALPVARAVLGEAP